MDYCTSNCLQKYSEFDYEKYCELAQQLCQQDTFQFIQHYYCMINQSFFLFIIFTFIFMVILFKAMDRVADSFLTPCVDTFIKKLHISSSLAGVTFVTFAVGAPDVLTAIVAGNSDSNSTVLIPFGSIFGAVLFCGAVILAVVIQVQPNNRLKVNKVQILQPLLFYVAGIIFLLIVSIFYGKMNIYISGVLVLLYVVHIVFHVYKEKNHKHVQLTDRDHNADQMEQPLNIADQEADKQNQQNRIMAAIDQSQDLFFSYVIPPITQDDWNPARAIISLTTSPFAMIFTQDANKIFNTYLLGIPLTVYISLPAILLLIHTFYLIITKKRPQNMVLYSLYSFLISVAWLTLVCAVLINLLELVQLLTDVNPVFLGLTLLAWANSIGDYLSITAFARKGNPECAIGGIFSGQLFNFLMGFAVSLLIRSIPGQFQFKIFDFKGNSFEVLSDSIIILVMGSGLVYLIIVGFMVWRLNGILGKRQGIIIIVFYAVFLLMSILISIISDFYRNYDCDWQPL